MPAQLKGSCQRSVLHPPRVCPQTTVDMLFETLWQIDDITELFVLIVEGYILSPAVRVLYMC
jgi:hypothetical protein